MISKEALPGRITRVSVDGPRQLPWRRALQTREAHQEGEGTSKLQSAQALLATMSGLYALYHGPEGYKNCVGIHGQLTISTALKHWLHSEVWRFISTYHKSNSSLKEISRDGNKKAPLRPASFLLPADGSISIS
jgi:glycine cleavage system pyridoxal-binding protein P